MKNIKNFLAISILFLLLTIGIAKPVLSASGAWSFDGSVIYYTDGNVNLGSSNNSTYKLNITGGTSSSDKANQIKINHSNSTDPAAERYWTIRTLQYGRADFGSYALEINQPAGQYVGCAGCGGDLILSPYKNIILRSSNSNIGNKVKVGINTINPTKDLSVNGTIVAKEVIVSNNSIYWPDYVFESEYNLQDLSYVESYIKENKHLPEVPSAKELNENGLSLSEISKIQMEKIEELTLYAIQQNQKIDKLEKEIDELRELILKK